MIDLLLTFPGRTGSSPMHAALVAMVASLILSLMMIPFQIARWLRRKKNIKDICSRCIHCCCQYKGSEPDNFHCGLNHDFKHAEKCLDNDDFMLRKTPIPVGNKEKTPFNFRNKFRDKIFIHKFAIAVTVVSAVLIIVSLILLPCLYNNELKNKESNATSVTAAMQYSFAFDGRSINRKSTVYLSSVEKDYYLFQSVGGEVYCYKCSLSQTNKAGILDYFDNVREEKPPLGMLVGGWLTAAIIFCALACSAAGGLWGRWYYLRKHEAFTADDFTEEEKKSIIANYDRKDSADKNDDDDEDNEIENEEEQATCNRKLIKGSAIRGNTVNLSNLAGVCKGWVTRDALTIILRQMHAEFDHIKNHLESSGNYYCVYVGATGNMKKRLQQHVKGPNENSALRRNLLTVVGDSNALNQFIDDMYFECIAVANPKDVKENLLSGKYTYLLNKQQ